MFPSERELQKHPCTLRIARVPGLRGLYDSVMQCMQVVAFLVTYPFIKGQFQSLGKVLIDAVKLMDSSQSHLASLLPGTIVLRH